MTYFCDVHIQSKKEQEKRLFIVIPDEEPTRTLYEQSKSAINRRFCYNMEKDSVKLIVKAHE